jgi:ABC-2 type transport system ATP-binding protein
VSGPALAVNEFVLGRQVLHHRTLATRASAVITGELSEREQRRATELHLSVEPLSLQELMVRTSEAATEERKSA